MTKIRVSIVEDIDEIRQGFSFLINSSDEFECVLNYSNAEDALEGVALNQPDVIIMDIGLPGMSGIDCTREIKTRFPAIQIMICSVYEDDERLFSSLAAGASGYILKRTSPGILLDAIKDLHTGGSPMSSQIARKLVSSLHVLKGPGQSVDLFNLSKREKEILDLLSDGYRNKEIAEKLFISVHTVKSHIYHIYDKLHVQSRVEALNKIASGK